MRAQWKDNPITGVKAGEAFIGDYQSAGIKKEKMYRYAKKILDRCGLVSFKGTNDGTVATLIGTSIFSTTVPDRGEQGADEGRARGGRGATTHKDTRKQGHKEDNQPSPIFEPNGNQMVSFPNPQGGNDDLFHDDPQSPPETPKDRCLPENWKRMSQGERKTTRVLSNSPTMIRIGRFFGRKGDTLWTVAETAALLSIKPTDNETNEMEKYYLADIPKDDDYRRHNLDTLLNNWLPELDRAKTYAANKKRDSR